MQIFYGVEVFPGKTSAFVPPPMDAQLHVSQATLSFDAKAGERVGVTVKVDEDGPDVLICSLREGQSESQSLDLIFDSYTEFKVVGNASVHLSGYYMPEHDHEHGGMQSAAHGEDDEDEEETDEEEEMDLDNLSPEDLQALAAYSRKHGMPGMEMDSEEEEEIDSDELDTDEDDKDEDEEDEDEEDDEMARKDSGIIITELNHDGSEKVVSDEEDNEDDEELDDEEDEEEGDLARGIQIDGGIRKMGGVQIDEAILVGGVQVASEPPAKRKGPAAAQEAPVSKRAKKAAEIAKAAAKDLVVQAATEEGPEQDAEDIIDMTAAAEQDKAVTVGEGKEADAATKQLSKKAKKKAAKEAEANAQTAVAAPENEAGKSVPIKHTRPKVQKFDNGFIIEDTHMGQAEGKEAKPGNKVSVRYKGWLAKNKQVFDQTKGSKTFNFRVGVGEVIKGWDRGVVGMRPGDKRRLTVPPQMAYGPTGVKGAIPGNATLIFDVELVDVKGK